MLLQPLTFPAQGLLLLRGLQWFPMAPGPPGLSYPPPLQPAWVPRQHGTFLVSWVLQAHSLTAREYSGHSDSGLSPPPSPGGFQTRLETGLDSKVLVLRGPSGLSHVELWLALWPSPSGLRGQSVTRSWPPRPVSHVLWWVWV